MPPLMTANTSKTVRPLESWRLPLMLEEAIRKMADASTNVGRRPAKMADPFAHVGTFPEKIGGCFRYAGG